jgi:Ca2+-binding EF-hand superfamily protein
MAFDYLDSDKSGKISANELKQRLGENISEDAYRDMMKTYDSNSDGEVKLFL